MVEINKKTRYEKLNVPGKIKIGDYLYIFKDQFKKDKNIFTYRCHKYIYNSNQYKYRKYKQNKRRK